MAGWWLGGQYAKNAEPLQEVIQNFIKTGNTTKRVVAKIANQRNVKAKFNYIPALWYSNLTVRNKTT
jgi:hypothetical protein